MRKWFALHALIVALLKYHFLPREAYEETQLPGDDFMDFSKGNFEVECGRSHFSNSKYAGRTLMRRAKS